MQLDAGDHRALLWNGYTDKTTVILWPDNGYHCGEKNHWEKTTLWEQAARTPMGIRLPGMANRERQCPRPVTAVDLFPTLVDLCGWTHRSTSWKAKACNPCSKTRKPGGTGRL